MKRKRKKNLKIKIYALRDKFTEECLHRFHQIEQQFYVHPQKLIPKRGKNRKKHDKKYVKFK